MTDEHASTDDELDDELEDEFEDHFDDELDDDAGGGLAGFDLGSLFGMATEMLAAHGAAADQEVIGSAGGGAVQVRVTGAGEFTGVTLSPAVVDPTDVSLLEDTILAALRDAMAKVQALQTGSLGALGGMAGLGGGALGGMAGLQQLLGGPNPSTAAVAGNELSEGKDEPPK